MKLFMKKVIFLFAVSCFITQISIIAQPEGFPPWDDFQKMLESRIIKVTIKCDDADSYILDEKEEWSDLIFELLQDGVEAKKRGQIKKASLIADCCYALSDCRNLVFTVFDGQYPSDWIEEFDITQYSPKQLEEFKYEWINFLRSDIEVECSLLVQYVTGRALAHCWQLREAMESYHEPKERVVNKEQNQPMRHIVSTTEPVSHYFATVAVCAAAGVGIIWLMNRETKAL